MTKTKESTMRKRVHTIATIAALAGLIGIAQNAIAEKADRDKPIRYSANSLDGNQTDQTVILNGKVEIQQGTIQLRADRVILKQQPDGSYNATATGKPVTFRQKMDNSDEYVDAQALRIEYLGSKELVELYEQGWIKRGKDELRGSFLTYNSSNGQFAGRGAWPPAQAAGGVDGRVSGVIQPKPKEAAETAPGGTAPGTPPATGTTPAAGAAGGAGAAPAGAGATQAPAGTATQAPAGTRLQQAPGLANPPKE
jgi:lipopolysaccharide export system protein LptA